MASTDAPVAKKFGKCEAPECGKVAELEDWGDASTYFICPDCQSQGLEELSAEMNHERAQELGLDTTGMTDDEIEDMVDEEELYDDEDEYFDEGDEEDFDSDEWFAGHKLPNW